MKNEKHNTMSVNIVNAILLDNLVICLNVFANNAVGTENNMVGIKFDARYY
jgi:hypothetical protein